METLNLHAYDPDRQFLNQLTLMLFAQGGYCKPQGRLKVTQRGAWGAPASIPHTSRALSSPKAAQV